MKMRRNEEMGKGKEIRGEMSKEGEYRGGRDHRLEAGERPCTQRRESELCLREPVDEK